MPKNSYEQEALERIQQMYSSANRSGSSPNGSTFEAQFAASNETRAGSPNDSPFDLSDDAADRSGLGQGSSQKPTRSSRSQATNSSGSQNNARRNSQSNSRRGQSHTGHSQDKSFNDEPFQNGGVFKDPSQKGYMQDKSLQNGHSQNEHLNNDHSHKESSKNPTTQNLSQNNAPFNAGADILDSFFKDKEKTLIMLLIAILSNDGANSSLILALMYLII